MDYLPTRALAIGGTALLTYLLCSKPKKPKKVEKFVVELNQDKTETKPIRSSEKLVETPIEGLYTVHDLFFKVAKENEKNPCNGLRPLIKLHKEDVIVDGKKKEFTIPELGDYQWKTYGEVADIMIKLGDGIVSFTGLKAGENFGIYEETRQEWIQTYVAMCRQATPIATCYSNLGIEALTFVINECKLTSLLCNASSIKTLDSLKDQIPTLKYLIYTDKLKEDSKHFKTISFDDCIKLGEKNPNKDLKKVGKDDIAVIMYTSGSTGNPKGVLISHGNISSFVASIMKIANISSKSCYLGYLPLAHILELAAETGFLIAGASIGYGNPRTITDKGAKPVGDIKALRPTHMAGVPRVYETIRKGAMEKIENSGAVTKFLFQMAYEAKVQALHNQEQTPFWDWLVFNKFKDQLGGRMEAMLSGGAPLSGEAQTFIRACFDVGIVQGYGLTETTGGIATQDLLDKNNFSTLNVGRPVPSLEYKLVSVEDMGYKVTDPQPRGEIVAKGNNITLGYYLNEKKTKEEYKDGWFYTGDIGRINEDGTLSIIDRKKNLVKLSQGEYVAVENLEMIYGTSKFISPNGICIYGNSYEDSIIAMIVPHKNNLLSWAKENGISGEYSELLKNDKVKKGIIEDLKNIGLDKKKKSFELVADCCLYEQEWTPESGMLTAAMKLKRENIQKAYQSDIDAMYKKLKK